MTSSRKLFIINIGSRWQWFILLNSYLRRYRLSVVLIHFKNFSFSNTWTTNVTWFYFALRWNTNESFIIRPQKLPSGINDDPRQPFFQGEVSPSSWGTVKKYQLIQLPITVPAKIACKATCSMLFLVLTHLLSFKIYFYWIGPFPDRVRCFFILSALYVSRVFWVVCRYIHLSMHTVCFKSNYLTIDDFI